MVLHELEGGRSIRKSTDSEPFDSSIPDSFDSPSCPFVLVSPSEPGPDGLEIQENKPHFNQGAPAKIEGMPNSQTMTRERAIDLVSGDYGTETLRQIASYVAPIFWSRGTADQGQEIRNGSIFFVDAGEGLFAVTASHVFKGYLEDRASSTSINGCQIAPNTFDPAGRDTVPFIFEERLIDCNEEADIATFEVLPEEMEAIGSTVLTVWPPMLPEENFGIGFAGFPGRARAIQGPREIEFGVYAGLSVATTINDRDVTCQIQREYIVPTPGFPQPPEGLELAGMSGGPLLTHVERNGINHWCLGGVIREANSQFELIFASRADRLDADGKISPANL